MSQNTLIEKIKNDAAEAVKEIKAAGSAEIENIQRAVEAEVAELTKTHEVALEKKKAQMELVAVSKAKQAGNIAVQSAKREQIDEILSAVADELAGQDKEAYAKFFGSFVANIVPKDADIVKIKAPKNRLEETAAVLEHAGLAGDVVADSSLKAGVVVIAKDGVYDVTLERLMNEKRAELEMIIVNKVGV